MKYRILLLLSLLAPLAYGQNMQQQQRVSRAADLERDLSLNVLNATQLEAHRTRAEQKLRDFYGLLGYQANQQYATMNTVSATEDRSLRLFHDTTATVAPPFGTGPALPVRQFLNALESNYDAVEFYLDSLQWTAPFTPTSPGTYQGQCTYTLTARAYLGGELTQTRTAPQSATVWLRQVEKDFGRRGSNLVWETSLGNIEWIDSNDSIDD